MPQKIFTRGFSFPELMVAMFIFVIIFMSGWDFAKNIISYNSSAQDSLNAQLEGRKVLKIMVSELRTTAPSVLGAYPLDTVGTSTLIFFADINGNNLPDRVRYFVDPITRTLKKGVVSPTGNPLTYNLGNEIVSTLVTNIANGSSTNVFDYYDSSYAGTTTPLSLPVDPSKVRLIKVSVLIDRDPNRSPGLITLISEVSLRNLKDNL